MKKSLFLIIICFLSNICMGCKLVENSLTDISGWDLSACSDHLSVCTELFTDNSDKILGGFNGF